MRCHILLINIFSTTLLKSYLSQFTKIAGKKQNTGQVQIDMDKLGRGLTFTQF
jgi:hypothetical protein